MAGCSGGWRIGRQRRRLFAAVAVIAAVLAGCGQGSASTSPSITAPAASAGPAGQIQEWGPATVFPEGWSSTTPHEVAALHVADDDRSLLVDTRFVPVRLAERACAGDIGGWTEDEGHPDVLWMMVRTASPNVLADPTLLRWEDEFGACPERRSTLELPLDAPLGGRDIVVDGARWVPGADGYEPCELPACDPETGAGPAVAACSDGGQLIEDVRTLGDVPRHSDIVEHRCEGRWAMVEVDIGSGSCPAGDGQNPCAGETIDRLFLRAGTPHWEVIGRTRDAGCGDITDVDADFPAALCADRPAL